MNTLFIDSLNFSNKSIEKKDINQDISLKESFRLPKISNLLKYEITLDILSHGQFYNNINLKIDEELLYKFASNKVNGLMKKIFEIILKSKVKNIETLNLVFSKNLDKKKNEISKRYILKVLSSINNLSLKEIVITNTMNINDIRYINDYIKSEKINPNKFKILVALDNIDDYSDKKMIEYISNFKYVDILKMSGIDKIRYKKLNEKIDKINDEYGTTIEITQKRNIQEYNVYLVYSKVDKDEFKSHYILRKKSKVFCMDDEEEDILNKNLKAYEKNKYDIETLFNRIGATASNYSKNKLGALMLENDEIMLDI